MNDLELKVPPHSAEAEQSVIGGLLLENDALDKIVDILSPADFYSHDHRLIFEHISKLIERNKPADIVTVAESLESSAKLLDVGGIVYLGTLAQNTPTAANIRRYAEIVHEKAVMRGLLSIAGGIQEACLGHGIGDAEKIAQDAENAMMRLLDNRGNDPKGLHDVFFDALHYIEERGENGEHLGGLPTGFDDFDSLTGGLEPGQLVIVAARPAVGKTIMGCNIANQVTGLGRSVLFFTLEMSAREIGMRILSSRTHVSVHDMRTGTKDNDHWKRLCNQLDLSQSQSLFVDDRPAISTSYVRAKARRMQRQHGLDLIVIDYLQLMRGQGDNRAQEIGSISRGLKALAKELNVPIIALAQLNRGVESRQDKRPMLSDLRDSGEVEQDADIVAMLHREELYSADPQWLGVAELLVRKNRNGPTGELLLSYKPEEMRFERYVGINIRRQQAVKSRSAGYKDRGFDE